MSSCLPPAWLGTLSFLTPLPFPYPWPLTSMSVLSDSIYLTLVGTFKSKSICRLNVSLCVDMSVYLSQKQIIWDTCREPLTLMGSHDLRVRCYTKVCVIPRRSKCHLYLKAAWNREIHIARHLMMSSCLDLHAWIFWGQLPAARLREVLMKEVSQHSGMIKRFRGVCRWV